MTPDSVQKPSCMQSLQMHSYSANSGRLVPTCRCPGTLLRGRDRRCTRLPPTAGDSLPDHSYRERLRHRTRWIDAFSRAVAWQASRARSRRCAAPLAVRRDTPSRPARSLPRALTRAVTQILSRRGPRPFWSRAATRGPMSVAGGALPRPWPRVGSPTAAGRAVGSEQATWTGP